MLGMSCSIADDAHPHAVLGISSGTSRRDRQQQQLHQAADTSSLGRFQFSDEKANTVSTRRRDRTQASTVFASVSTPCRCPAMRGMKRLLAQRPLPSMTMAM
jgi:hypothetical protein